MVILNIDNTGKLNRTKLYVVRDSIGQIKLLCYVAILCRFMHDQSFMLALLNVFIIGIIGLMNRLITYQGISMLEDHSENDDENDNEIEIEILKKVVRKFSKNLQILVVLQVVYSLLYHYYLPDDKEKNILVYLLYVEYGFDYGKEGGPPRWVAYLFVVVVDLLVLGCELLLLSVNENFFRLRMTYGLPLNTSAGIFRDMTVAGVSLNTAFSGTNPSVAEAGHPTADVELVPILSFLTENYYDDQNSQVGDRRRNSDSLVNPGRASLYGSIV